CKENDIVIESWSPLGRANYLSDERLERLAQKYQKTVAQIMIRWHIQHDFVVIPKSTHPARQAENFHVFVFELSAEDMSVLGLLDNVLKISSHSYVISQFFIKSFVIDTVMSKVFIIELGHSLKFCG